MKKWVLLFLLSLIITVSSGCFKNNTDVSFNRIPLNETPLKVQEWANPLIQSPNTAWLHLEDKTYILVARGKMRTGGFDIKIQTVKAADKDLMVTYTVTDPKPGQIVTQAITFPYDLGWIVKTDLPVGFKGPDLSLLSRRLPLLKLCLTHNVSNKWVT